MKFFEDKEILLTEGSDLLNTKPYAETLVKTIEAAPPSFNIGVFGEWGSGKSSVIHTVKDKIESSSGGKSRVFIYDAWKYSGDSFRRMFLLELRASLEIEAQELFKSFYEDRTEDVSVDRRVKPTSLIIFAAAILVFSISLLLQQEIKDVVQMIGTILMVLVIIFNDMFQESKVVVHKPMMFAPEQFQDCYSELLEIAFKKSGLTKRVFKWFVTGIYPRNLDRLIIVVDNLDRCDHRVTYQLLSDIKNFLSDRMGVVFVIPVDDNAIRQHLMKHYTADENSADEFLRKFFNVAIKLKPLAPIDLFSFTERLCRQKGINFSPNTIDAISREFATNPRRIIQILNNLSAEIEVLNSSGEADLAKTYETLIAVMLVLREEWPSTYQELFRHPELLFEIEKIGANHEAAQSFIRRVSGLLVNIDIAIVERLFKYVSTYSSVPGLFLEAIEKRDSNAITSALTKEPQSLLNVITYFVDQLKKALDRGTLRISGVDVFQKVCFLNAVIALDKNSALSFNAIFVDSPAILPGILPYITRADDFALLIKTMESHNILYISTNTTDQLVKQIQTARDNAPLKQKALSKEWGAIFLAVCRSTARKDLLAKLKPYFGEYCTAEEIMLSDIQVSDDNLSQLINVELAQKRIEALTFENQKTFSDVIVLAKLSLLDSDAYVACFESLENKYNNLSDEPYVRLKSTLKNMTELLALCKSSIKEKLTEDTKPVLNWLFEEFDYEKEGETITGYVYKDFIHDPEVADTFFDYCYHVYRISGNTVEASAPLIQIAEANDATSVKALETIVRLKELHYPLDPFHNYLCTQTVFSSTHIELLKYILEGIYNDQSPFLSEERLDELVENIIENSQKNSAALDLLPVFEKNERCTQALRKALIDLGRDNLVVLPSKLLAFAFDYICEGERIFEYESNSDLLRAIAHSGTTSNKNALILFLINKLTRTETVQYAVDILAAFRSFEDVDTNEIKSLLRKQRKSADESYKSTIDALLDKMKKPKE